MLKQAFPDIFKTKKLSESHGIEFFFGFKSEAI